MEGGDREEGRKGMEARLAWLLEKLIQMTDTSEFSRLIWISFKAFFLNVAEATV